MGKPGRTSQDCPELEAVAYGGVRPLDPHMGQLLDEAVAGWRCDFGPDTCSTEGIVKDC